jgi:hypothetical protein
VNGRRSAYLAALGARDSKQRHAAFSRAHQIRQFEIDLYWKRANYFWLLQAAVFTAFGLVWRDASARTWGLLPAALACLGFLTSLAGWFASQGSKFWQSNWEFHIDMLEDEFEGRLHKTVRIGGLGVRWSVSGINDRLNLCFVAFWLFVVVGASARAFGGRPIEWGLSLTGIDWDRTLLLALILSTAVAALFLLNRLSDLRGAVVELGANHDGQSVQRWPHFLKVQSRNAILKRAGGS